MLKALKYLSFFSVILAGLLNVSEAKDSDYIYCIDSSAEISGPQLTLEQNKTYGVLGRLRFGDLEANVICNEVANDTLECLGHWAEEGQIQDKIEIYIVDQAQDQGPKAFFSLPYNYGKKEIWLNCSLPSRQE